MKVKERSAEKSEGWLMWSDSSSRHKDRKTVTVTI